ncbi:CehA/McbA family metallohydrolase [Candidatus Bathyarchaeota archaeon]|nr:CehA/McbA family metallohydrolase [Candidatus Bathyarchaeota archaeon]
MFRFSDPFTAPGKWRRGNLHTHTVHSDGHLTPEEHVDLYRRAGYGFLAITDHGKYIDTRGLASAGFAMIQGQEVSVGSTSAGSLYHIIALGIQEPVAVREADPDENPQRVIDLINAQGGVAVIAHPYWSGLTHAELLALKRYCGVEVYNHTCELLNDRGDSAQHWDGLLTSLRHPLGFAVDDAHSRTRELLPSDACGGWINVMSEEPTEESILDSVKRGLFYASQGPELKCIEVEDGVIRVESSPVKKMAFVSLPCRGLCYKAPEGLFTEASYRPSPRELYIRVQVTDEYGRRAWSNPIYQYS